MVDAFLHNQAVMTIQKHQFYTPNISSLEEWYHVIPDILRLSFDFHNTFQTNSKFQTFFLRNANVFAHASAVSCGA